jgi:hypothetical protein
MIFQEVKRRPLYLVKGWTRDSERMSQPVAGDVAKDLAAAEGRGARE